MTPHRPKPPDEAEQIVEEYGVRYRLRGTCDRCGQSREGVAARLFKLKRGGHVVWVHSTCQTLVTESWLAARAKRLAGPPSGGLLPQKEPQPELFRVADEWSEDEPDLEEILRERARQVSGEPSAATPQKKRTPLVAGKPPGGDAP